MSALRRWITAIIIVFREWMQEHRLIFAGTVKRELDGLYERTFPRPWRADKERDEQGRELYYRLGFCKAIGEIGKRLNIPLTDYKNQEGPDR